MNLDEGVAGAGLVACPATYSLLFGRTVSFPIVEDVRSIDMALENRIDMLDRSKGQSPNLDHLLTECLKGLPAVGPEATTEPAGAVVGDVADEIHRRVDMKIVLRAPLALLVLTFGLDLVEDISGMCHLVWVFRS